jgi:hypothetical protein
MASGMNGLHLLRRRKRISRRALSDVINRRSIEALVTQAYVQLVLVSWDENGSRAVSLAKYGNYEVRLREVKSADAAEIPHLWVELYANDIRASIDACHCDDIEAAAMAAEYIMSQAQKLEHGEAQPRARPVTQ